VEVIHNGIDTTEYAPTSDTSALERYGIDAQQPYVLFVGRVTRQKGIIHLVRAIPNLDRDIGVVLAAGQPDTPEIAAEMEEGVAEARRHHPNVTWIPEMIDLEAKVQFYSHAAVFCCPSIYEPFGIINLEAMACCTPVVASAVGGIPEVVVDGETGLLVPLEQEQESPFEPRDPRRFSADLAAAINRLLADPGPRERMAWPGRDAVDQDLRRQGDRQAVGQVGQAGLRDGVGDAAAHRLEAGRRADVDDPAAALALHHRRDRPGAEERAGQVGVEDLLPQLEG